MTKKVFSCWHWPGVKKGLRILSYQRFAQRAFYGAKVQQKNPHSRLWKIQIYSGFVFRGLGLLLLFYRNILFFWKHIITGTYLVNSNEYPITITAL